MYTKVDKNYINRLEKIAFDVHPPLKQMNYDGWLLGFSEGYTRRANSILAFDWGQIPAEDKIRQCIKLYTDQNLPCIFKVTDASAEGIKIKLEEEGFKSEAPTDVMLVSPEDPEFLEQSESIIEPEDIGVIVTGSPDMAWLNAFLTFEDISDSKKIDVVTSQFDMIEANDDLTSVYCRLQIHGEDVAVASAVIEDGVMFLLNVVVDKNRRGNGYGKIIVKETLEAACNFGAEQLCLQVVQDNYVAIGLYKSFGFKKIYDYIYYVKKY